MTTKKSNKSFVLAVVFMVALLMLIITPTTIAWFTDTGTANINSTIDFGTVAVGINDDNAKTFITPAVSRKIVPGDVLNYQFEIYNAGNVDELAKARYSVYVTYDGEDITSQMSQYMEIADTTDSDIYDADATNKIMLLETTNTKGSGKVMTGTITILTDLPNEVGDYQFNGKTTGVKIGLRIKVASIQKDNNTLPVANTELTKLLAPTYTLAGSGTGAKVYEDGVEISGVTAAYDVSKTSSDNVIAYTTDDNRLVFVGQGEMRDFNLTSTPHPEDPSYDIVDSDIPYSTCSIVEVKEGVTNIGAYACVEEYDSLIYANGASIETFIVASSVTSIGNGITNGNWIANGYTEDIVMNVYFLHEAHTQIRNYENIGDGTYGGVGYYSYSETEQAGCWHYVNDVPTLW